MLASHPPAFSSPLFSSLLFSFFFSSLSSHLIFSLLISSLLFSSLLFSFSSLFPLLSSLFSFFPFLFLTHRGGASLLVSPSPPTGLGGNQLHSPKIDLFHHLTPLNFTSQTSLNLTPLQTLLGPHLDPPWATQIDPRSTKMGSR